MLAGEIAAPDQVPDDHRAGRAARAAPTGRRRDDLLADSGSGGTCGARVRSGDAQAGLLQDARREQNVVAARRRSDQRAMRVDLVADLVARAAVHHGEQVVGPERQVARPLVAMGDEIERADLRDRSRRPPRPPRPTPTCRWPSARARSDWGSRRCGGSRRPRARRFSRATTSSSSTPTTSATAR